MKSNAKNEDSDAAMRHSVYCLLIVIGTAILAGRIATVSSKTGEVPFLSANDRSRWCTISSLVDDGTFAIDRQVTHRVGERKRRVWHTIDMVRHRGPDGKQHYYSSKPPLYPTMLAGVYAVFKSISGASIMEYPFVVGRWMLVFVNLLPMIGYFAGMIWLIERYGKTNYGRMLTAATLTCGTLVLPFAISISNHVPAAWCSALVLACVLSVKRQPAGGQILGLGVESWLCFLGGIAGGFAAANELPALSMTCLWAVVLFWQINLRAAIVYGAGVAVVAIAFFGVNYYAHESWRPPYAHRGVGTLIGDVPCEQGATPALDDALSVLQSSEEGIGSEGDGLLQETSKPGMLEVYFPSSEKRFALRETDGHWRLYQWDDWYEYSETYWQPGSRSGVDKGEPSRLMYAFNATLGHHGIFSLTPIWLLSVIGGLMLAARRECIGGEASGASRSLSDDDGSVVRQVLNLGHVQQVSLSILLASAVCFAFYIARPLVDRNYGGVSCAFRWMLWFAPLWIWQMIPAADRLADSRFLRGLGLALLAASVFSVVTSLQNPWQHPWIYRYWDYLGWIAY